MNNYWIQPKVLKINKVRLIQPTGKIYLEGRQIKMMLLNFRIALLKLKNRFLIRPVKLISMIRLINISKMMYRKFYPVKIGRSWK